MKVQKILTMQTIRPQQEQLIISVLQMVTVLIPIGVILTAITVILLLKLNKMLLMVAILYS